MSPQCHDGRPCHPSLARGRNKTKVKVGLLFMSFDTPFSQTRDPIIPLKREVSLQCHDGCPLPSLPNARSKQVVFRQREALSSISGVPLNDQSDRADGIPIGKRQQTIVPSYMQDNCNVKKSDLQAQQVFSGPLVHTFSIESASEIFG